MNIPNQTERKMPTEKAIRSHWVDRLWKIKGFDCPEEFMEPGVCFACTMVYGILNGKGCIERAHIKARVAGGDDSLENLHMLCPVCHKDSEFIPIENYMGWLVSRNSLDMIISAAIKRGFNPSRLLNPI